MISVVLIYFISPSPSCHMGLLQINVTQYFPCKSNSLRKYHSVPSEYTSSSLSLPLSRLLFPFHTCELSPFNPIKTLLGKYQPCLLSESLSHPPCLAVSFRSSGPGRRCLRSTLLIILRPVIASLERRQRLLPVAGEI